MMFSNRVSVLSKFVLNFSVAIIATLGLSHEVHAQQQIKVLKAKGQRGIVQFPRGMAPKAGDTFTISTGGGDESISEDGGGGGGGPTGRRKYKLGFSIFAAKEAGQLGPNEASSGTSFGFGIGARPGFVLGEGQFELGPILAITKVGSVGFGGGAFFEFNFVKNASGEVFIPGIALQGTFSKLGSLKSIDASGTVFGKIFVLGTSSTCLRVDAGAAFSKPVGGGSSNIGFGMSGGLEAYF